MAGEARHHRPATGVAEKLAQDEESGGVGVEATVCHEKALKIGRAAVYRMLES
jgi:hypothetical protein